MAHVTVKLIWYRLGELRENMEELYQQALNWHAEFSWQQVDIIDLLFVFWIAFGVLVAGLVQVSYKLFGGRTQSSSTAARTKASSSPKKRVPVGPVESCQWLNSVINWVYLNYNSTPEYVNAWLRGLNDQAKKHEGSLQIRFDRILAGSLPPRITNINTEAGPKDSFTLRGSLDASELGFQILVSEHTASNVRLTNCDINVQALKAELNVQSVLQKEDVHVFVRMEGEPDIILLIKPHPKSEKDPQTKKDLEATIDVPLVDELVKRCLSHAITHFKLHTSQFDSDVHTQFVTHLNSSNRAASNHLNAKSSVDEPPLVALKSAPEAALAVAMKSAPEAALAVAREAALAVAPEAALEMVPEAASITHAEQAINFPAYITKRKSEGSDRISVSVDAPLVEPPTTMQLVCPDSAESTSNDFPAFLTKNKPSVHEPKRTSAETTKKPTVDEHVRKSSPEYQRQEVNYSRRESAEHRPKTSKDVQKRRTGEPSRRTHADRNYASLDSRKQSYDSYDGAPVDRHKKLYVATSAVSSEGSTKVNGSLESDESDFDLHAPPKPPRTPEALLRQDKRLLVKVIKASGLGAKDIGCNDPYCTVELDEPAQRHTTSVVRNAVNPFWDESFLFDLGPQSRELIIEVYDKDKAPGDDFLGMAAVNIDDLKKQPSSRHIIPLSGRQPGTGKGGNITLEFLFMDPAELPVTMHQDERDLMMATAASLSPRRRVDTQRTVMPGGLIVTTQTTTMDHGPSNESPVNEGSKSATMPARDAPNKQIPEIKVKRQMTQSTPTEEHGDGRVSSASSDRSNKTKRSSSLASTLRKRFNKVRKPRSHSADRAAAREDDRLRPPEQYASGSKSTDRSVANHEEGKVKPTDDFLAAYNAAVGDEVIVIVDDDVSITTTETITPSRGGTRNDMDGMEPIPGHQTNLKKSKSLGSSLKKLFKGKKGKAQKNAVEGERSRESSVSRSRDHLSPGQQSPHTASRDGSYQQSPSPQLRRNQQRDTSRTERISTSSAV